MFEIHFPKVIIVIFKDGVGLEVKSTGQRFILQGEN